MPTSDGELETTAQWLTYSLNDIALFDILLFGQHSIVTLAVFVLSTIPISLVRGIDVEFTVFPRVLKSYEILVFILQALKNPRIEHWC